MKTSVRLFIQTTMRLGRLKDLRWWILPSAVLCLTLAVVFGFLNTMELSQAAKLQLNFGNKTTSINLNDLVRPSDRDGLQKFEEVVLVGLTKTSPCAQIGAIVNAPDPKNVIMQFSEISGSCSFKNFGYKLTVGHWPLRPNEVMVSTNLPYKVGSFIRGVSPIGMTVVGKVTNPGDTYSTALLAGTGTWDSWNMAVNELKFPRLQSNYSLYFSTKNLAKVKNRLYALSRNSPLAGSVQLSDVGEKGTTLIDKFPFLYKWLVWPLAFFGVAFSLLLRRRQLKVTRLRLVENGLSFNIVESAVISSSGIWLAFLFPITGFVGWLAAGFLSHLVPIFAGHTPGINPFPIKTIWTFEQALLYSCFLLVIVNNKFRPGKKTSPKGLPRTRSDAAILKTSLLALGSSAFLAYFTYTRTVNDLFALLFIMLFLVTLTTPDLTNYLARRLKPSRLSSTYAKLRITAQGSKSWMTMASASLAFGPFIVVAVLISSSVAFSEENQKVPPRPGQAVFYPSGEDTFDKKVTAILERASGGDAKIVPYFSPVDISGSGAVASKMGLGAIGSIRSANDLSLLLGERIPRLAERTLTEGGVVWLRPALGKNVWLMQQKGPKLLTTKSSSYFASSRFWSNDTAGFISTATAVRLGLSNKLSLYTANRVSTKMRKSVPQMLVAVGLDSNFVKFFKPLKAMNITPFQIAVGAILGLIGIALLIISLRGSLVGLVSTSRNLALQGVPKSWFGSVYAIETGLLTLVGLVLGTVFPLCLLYFGTQRLGLPVVIPFELLAEYVTLMALVYSVILLLGSRRLLRSTI